MLSEVNRGNSPISIPSSYQLNAFTRICVLNAQKQSTHNVLPYLTLWNLTMLSHYQSPMSLVSFFSAPAQPPPFSFLLFSFLSKKKTSTLSITDPRFQTIWDK